MGEFIKVARVDEIAPGDAKAVEAAGTDNADAVLKVLRNATLNDAFVNNGKIRADGRMMRDVYLSQVKTPEESKAPWDYYHIRSVISADDAFQPLSKSRCPLVTQ